MKIKVAIVLGTRPEAIKLVPVYLELKKNSAFDVTLISTGQHASMLRQIFDFFGIIPDVELDVMQPNQTLSSLTSILFNKIGEFFVDNRFDYVLVQGDTTTAFVAAVSAHYYKFSLVHVEAGLRTNNKWAPFPEECNRKMISAIADIHFTPTEMASDNLRMEKITDNVIDVGNTIIDSLLLTISAIDKNKEKYEKKLSALINADKKTILVTGHRRESFDKGLGEISKALLSIVDNYPDTRIIYPVHMNPNVRKIVHAKLGKNENIKLIDPMPYDELIYIMRKCWLVMTDSGGIQEEAPTLNLPVIVMRDSTERMEAVENGCSLLSGTSSENILTQFERIIGSSELYEKMAVCVNPYGKGGASRLIVEFLENHSLNVNVMVE